MIEAVVKGEADGAAIGGRLRRLSERIDREAAAIYRKRKVDFEQRWYGPINLIAQRGPLSVTEIARLLGVSHAAISQVRRRLVAAGHIVEQADPADGRSRLLALTDRGVAIIDQLTPFWTVLNDAARALNAEAGDVANALDRLEKALDRQSLAARCAPA